MALSYANRHPILMLNFNLLEVQALNDGRLRLGVLWEAFDLQVFDK